MPQESKACDPNLEEQIQPNPNLDARQRQKNLQNPKPQEVY